MTGAGRGHRPVCPQGKRERAGPGAAGWRHAEQPRCWAGRGDGVTGDRTGGAAPRCPWKPRSRRCVEPQAERPRACATPPVGDVPGPSTVLFAGRRGQCRAAPAEPQRPGRLRRVFTEDAGPRVPSAASARTPAPAACLPLCPRGTKRLSLVPPEAEAVTWPGTARLAPRPSPVGRRAPRHVYRLFAEVSGVPGRPCPNTARPCHLSWGQHGHVGTRTLVPGLHSLPHCAEELGGPAGHMQDAGPDQTQTQAQRPERLPELPARGGEDKGSPCQCRLHAGCTRDEPPACPCLARLLPLNISLQAQSRHQPRSPPPWRMAPRAGA